MKEKGNSQIIMEEALRGASDSHSGVMPWEFTPEGAAVHPVQKVAVIADVHLGYEWARAAGGDMIPPHSLAETIDRLASMFDRFLVRRLVVAGDLVESARACRRTARDVEALRQWLADREIELVWLAGNHDPRGGKLPPKHEVDGWTIGHGDRPLSGDRLMMGHHHPALRVGNLAAPCFLVSPSRILLPAFSRNAAGMDVTQLRLPESWRDVSFHCLAGVGTEILDFGPLEELRERLQRLAGDPPSKSVSRKRTSIKRPSDQSG